MGRLSKKVTALTVLLSVYIMVIIGGGVQSVMKGSNEAFAEPPDSTFLRSKPTDWKQNEKYCQWCGKTPLGSASGDLTVADAGCMQFTMVYLLVKMGARPIGYWVKDHYDECAKRGDICIHDSGGSGLVHNMLPNSKGAVVSVKRAQPANVDLIKKYWNDGYLIVLNVPGSDGNIDPGHWVAVDSIEGDKVMVVDSSWGYVDFAHHPHYNGRAIVAHLLKMAPGKEPKNIPTAPQLEGGARAAGGNTEGGILGPDTSLALSEKELEGMPNVSYLYENQKDVPAPQGEVDISLNERVSVKDLNTAIKEHKNSTQKSYIGVGVGVLSIGLVIWCIVILLAIGVDLVIGTRALTLVTLGGIYLRSSKDDVKNGKARPVGIIGVIGVMAVLILVSMLLISGIIYKWVLMVLGYMRG